MDFFRFQSDDLWNTNIASAPIDPNSAAITAVWATAGNYSFLPLFGSAQPDSGIPYYVVDSTQTPLVPVVVTGSPTQSEVVRVPLPDGDLVPMEGDDPDCSIWPDTDVNDDHSLVLDRATCWIYEAWVASRCIGSDNHMHWENNSLTIFDATNANARPWGWTSGDALGTSMFAGTLKYDEAASGVVNHAIRFTMSGNAKDSHSGYYLLPGTHTDGTSTTSKNVEGMRVRLKASTNISGYSAINQAILTGLMNYGMILDDTGSNFFVIGDIDPRWDDNDTSNLRAITSADFDVIQEVPAYPGMDNVIAPEDYPETLPSITSFTANGQTGTLTVPNTTTPVTFNFCVTGANWNESFTGTTAQPYVYIDEAGPQRLTAGCGSATITPTITQKYTLYALNTAGRAPGSTINIVVSGAPLTPAAPVLVPPPGTYAADSLKVTPVTSSWAPTTSGAQNATYFYTTSTGTGSPVPPVAPSESGGTAVSPTLKLSTSATASVTVTKAASGGNNGYEVLCVIATVPAIGSSYGNSNPSPVTCGTYIFTGTSTSYADAPIIYPPGGTFNTPPRISMSTGSLASSSVFAEIFFTTDGSTPAAVNSYGYPPGPDSTPVETASDMVYAMGYNNTCYGGDVPFGAIPSCNPTEYVIATNGMTIQALTGTLNSSTGALIHSSTVTTATYSIITSTPTFSPAGGSYIGTQTVTLSDASPSSTIYFTTDASTPTTGSAVYSSPLTISATTTVRAMAASPGAANSAVANGIYTILIPAAMITPTSGSTLGSSQAFTWSPGNGVSHYELWVGNTAVGSSNLYNSGSVTVTTETVNSLPSNGQPLYVRLYSLINGSWQSADYAYTASGAPIAASMSTPTPGSTLASTSQAFTWNPGNVATHFELWVGTTGVGSSNLYNSGNVTVTTETASGLPSNDSPVYVRLYSLINGAWQSADYTYTSSGTAVPASMSTPTPGSTLGSTSQAFTWTPGNNATHFELWVGSTGVGSSNVYNSGNVTVTTETVNGLPSNGQPLYVRLYSLINGGWQSADYTYTASGAPIAASMSSPTGGSTLGGASQAFTWNPGNTATHFELWVGSTGVGSSNVYNSGNVTVTTETVNGLPSNGQPLYVRLYSLINGAWQSADYTYTASGAPIAASMTSPTPGSQFLSTSQAFVWSPGNTATHFELWLGSTGVGSSNLYNSGNVTVTTETVNGLPTNGETIYVRLYSLINGAWQSADYTYTAQ